MAVRVKALDRQPADLDPGVAVNAGSIAPDANAHLAGDSPPRQQSLEGERLRQAATRPRIASGDPRERPNGPSDGGGGALRAGRHPSAIGSAKKLMQPYVPEEGQPEIDQDQPESRCDDIRSMPHQIPPLSSEPPGHGFLIGANTARQQAPRRPQELRRPRTARRTRCRAAARRPGPGPRPSEAMRPALRFAVAAHRVGRVLGCLGRPLSLRFAPKRDDDRPPGRRTPLVSFGLRPAPRSLRKPVNHVTAGTRGSTSRCRSCC